METQKVTFTVSLKGGVCFNMRSATAWNYMELRTKELNISTEKACFLKKSKTNKKNLSKQRCKSEAKHKSRSEYGMILTMVTGIL